MQSKLFSFVLVLGLGCVLTKADSSNSSRDEDEAREYPCDDLDDHDCIRHVLSSRGQCIPVTHEYGRPIIRDRQVGHMPTANMTVTCAPYRCTFLDYKVLTFYIIKSTNTIVITIEIKHVIIETHSAKWTLYGEPGEPQTTLTEAVKVDFAIILTISIAYDGPVTAANIAVSPWATNPYPSFTIGPKITESSLEIVQKSYSAILNNLPTCVMELVNTKGRNFAMDFIDTHLCFYGFKPTDAVNYCA